MPNAVVSPTAAACPASGSASAEMFAGGEVRLAASVAVGAAARSGPTHIRRCAMAALLIGYARCSTDQQDLTAQPTA